MGTPALSPFQIEVRAAGDTMTIVLAGEFDLDAVRSFNACVDAAIESTERAVVVDMVDVTFIDSTAISALLQFRRRLGGQGRAMRVIPLRPSVARVFELAGLGDLVGGAHPQPTGADG
jgi:anti-anti-sigma factor